MSCLDGLLPLMDSYPFDHLFNKLKPLYLYNHSVYCHQTCKDGDLPLRAPNHKIIWCSHHAVLQGHAANENHYISNTRVFNALIKWSCKITWSGFHVTLWVGAHQGFISTTRGSLAKLGTIITYLDMLLIVKSHDILTTWSSQITWQTKIIIYPIPLCLWTLDLVGRWLTLSNSHP